MVKLDDRLVGRLRGRVAPGQLIVVDQIPILGGIIFLKERDDLVRNWANHPRGNFISHKDIACLGIEDGALVNRVARRIRPQGYGSVQKCTEISVEKRRSRHRSRTTESARSEVPLRVAFEGAKKERVIFDDRPSEAASVIPGPIGGAGDS